MGFVALKSELRCLDLKLRSWTLLLSCCLILEAPKAHNWILNFFILMSLGAKYFSSGHAQKYLSPDRDEWLATDLMPKSHGDPYTWCLYSYFPWGPNPKGFLRKDLQAYQVSWQNPKWWLLFPFKVWLKEEVLVLPFRLKVSDNITS